MVSFGLSEHKLFFSSQALHYLQLLTKKLFPQRMTFWILQISAKMSLRGGCSISPHLKWPLPIQFLSYHLDFYYPFTAFVTVSNNYIYCFTCLLCVFFCNSAIRSKVLDFLVNFFIFIPALYPAASSHTVECWVNVLYPLVARGGEYTSIVRFLWVQMASA